MKIEVTKRTQCHCATIHWMASYLYIFTLCYHCIKFLKNLLISSVSAFMSVNSMCCAGAIFPPYSECFLLRFCFLFYLLMLVLFWHILQLICNVVNAFAEVILRDAMLFIESTLDRMDKHRLPALYGSARVNFRIQSTVPCLFRTDISIISLGARFRIQWMRYHSRTYTTYIRRNVCIHELLYPLHSC